jgi:hypothetical protein
MRIGCATLDAVGKSSDSLRARKTTEMASYQDFADDYAKRIRAGARAEDIAREIDALVYEGNKTPLSAEHKAYLAGLIKAHFESLHGSAVPGQPGAVYIRDNADDGPSERGSNCRDYIRHRCGDLSTCIDLLCTPVPIGAERRA